MISDKIKSMLTGMLLGFVILLFLITLGLLGYLIASRIFTTPTPTHTFLPTITKTEFIWPATWTPTVTPTSTLTPTYSPPTQTLTPTRTNTPFKVKIPKQPVYTYPQSSQSGSCPSAYDTYLHETYLQYITSSYQSLIDNAEYYLKEDARMGDALDARYWTHWIGQLKDERDSYIEAENASYSNICK